MTATGADRAPVAVVSRPHHAAGSLHPGTGAAVAGAVRSSTEPSLGPRAGRRLHPADRSVAPTASITTDGHVIPGYPRRDSNPD